jgi:DNA modification methylase
MRITCQTRDTLALEELTEFQGGIKKRSTRDIALITESFQKLGFSFPFYVWKNGERNMIIDGHGRLLALKYMRDRLQQEIPALPVVYIAAESEAEAKEKLLQCNARYGLFVETKLKDWLAGVNFDPMKIKIPDVNVNKLVQEMAEVKIRFGAVRGPVSVPGVVYHLLNASVICGDATDSETFNALLKKERIDLALTSPPYNQKSVYAPAYDDRKPLYRDQYVDEKSEAEQIAMCIKVLENISRFVKERHAVVWNVSYSKADRNSYGKVVFSPRNPFQVMETIAWDKGLTNNFQNMLYRRCELIFVMARSEREYLYNALSDRETNYWNISSQGAQQEIHKACFPLNLATKAVKLFSDSGGAVLDPFCGAGTTLIAGQLLGRKAYGIELSPVYVDLIRRRFTRWATELGFSAREIGDGYWEDEAWAE